MLGVDIQTAEHSSVEDARTTMAIYRAHKAEWDKTIASGRPIKAKPLSAAQLKATIDPTRRYRHASNLGLAALAKSELSPPSEALLPIASTSAITLEQDLSAPISLVPLQSASAESKRNGKAKKSVRITTEEVVESRPASPAKPGERPLVSSLSVGPTPVLPAVVEVQAAEVDDAADGGGQWTAVSKSSRKGSRNASAIIAPLKPQIISASSWTSKAQAQSKSQSLAVSKLAGKKTLKGSVAASGDQARKRPKSSGEEWWLS